jgi:hypothetical protein
MGSSRWLLRRRLRSFLGLQTRIFRWGHFFVHARFAILVVFIGMACLPCWAEDRVPFHEGVLAALSRQGCSAGACHGSPTGKGGFRLSLRGFDPVLDEQTLIREDFGRRVNPHDPEASLLLLKPLMTVSHGGGQKLRKTDAAYAILRDWIAQGARPDSVGTVASLKIEVQPKQAELRYPAWTQVLRVVGHFSDGSTRDLTHLAVFSSSDESVASVSAGGLVTGTGRGEATILVRYLDHIDTASFLLHEDVPGFAWTGPLHQNFIDEHVFAKLKKLQLAPAELSSDYEFIRRVYLDTVGLLPARAEVETFAADASAEKRNELIDRLLARPEFAEQLAQRWADVLRVKSGRLGSAGTHKLHRWLVAAMERNMPYDELVRTLLTAEGSTLANPPAGFYRAAADTNECAEATAQLFLAARIQCAKCHNHPFDRWSQDQYHGLGAVFARVQRKTTSVEGETMIFTAAAGETIQPRTGKVVQPGVPGQAEFAGQEQTDRRVQLADWLASPDNRLFAKVGANRIWGWLFGRGIVEPVDDLRDSNPPANAELLDALAAEFARSGFDQKQLVRTILRSRTYQLSSRSAGQSEKHAKYFAAYPARVMPAEQLVDAISQVTGASDNYPGLPSGTRAGQLPSPELGGHMLKVFGQPGRDTVCACERSSEPKLSQPLLLLNGVALATKLADRRGRLAKHLDQLGPRLSAAGEPPSEGRVLWLRADAGVIGGNGQTAAEGAAVARWSDQSGSEHHASQDDATRRPSFVSRAIGDLPAVRFDGLDDMLSNTAANLHESGQPRTMLAVGHVSKGGRGGAIACFRRSTADGGTVFAAQHIKLGGVYYVYSDGVNGAGNSTVPIERFAALQEPFVTSFVSRGAGQKLLVAVNGREQLVSQPGAIGPDAGAAGFTIGSREDIPPGAQNWQGDLAEILVYDCELSAESLAAAGAYLATKYALKTEYPSRTVAHSSATRDEQRAADRAFLTDFYFAALARPATEDELAVALAHLDKVGDRRAGLEDVCWAVLNAKEFVFQH